ncbi:MAG: hypothetical protein H0T89_02245 [Deltaproteobacteria bacterium]|nr:hypothetical protein [Deltaproteobacteria bacterium]
MTFAAHERRPASQLRGLDLIRLGFDSELASWAVGQRAGGPRIGAAVAFAWSFGCYRGDILETPLGDMAPPSRHVGCGETLTTTYIVGLHTSIAWL